MNIGEYFFFGSYKDFPIKWVKVAKNMAISAYILEEMPLSNVRTWCNELCAQLELAKDSLYNPIVYSSSAFGAHATDSSYVGVRPVLVLN